MNRSTRRRSVLIQALEPRVLMSLAAQGPESRVNTFTPGSQSAPAMAMDGDGDFVVAWSSYGQEGANFGIYAQRYDASGVAQGAEFHVNTFTTNNQSAPAVAMDADGDFVVTWFSFTQDGSDGGIYARRYDAAGVAQSGEFRVNTVTAGQQTSPAVAMDVHGNFVVAWQSFAQDGSATGIYAQRYNTAGVAQGAEFRVNTYTTSDQRAPAAAMDASGDFVIAWQSTGQDGPASEGIYAQRFSAAGVAQGGEVAVNTTTTLNQAAPTVAMDADGDFVVAWGSGMIYQYFSVYEVYAQRYDAVGTAQGGEFLVNTHTTSDQRFPAAAMDVGGDFVISWESDGQDGSGQGVYAQAYDATGAAQGVEFPVNTFTVGNQRNPSVAIDHDGDLVVAWHSNGQDGSFYGVYAQRFDESTDTAGPMVGGVFVNRERVLSYGSYKPLLSTILVTFSQDVTGAGDPSNWLLTHNGADVSAQIAYGFNSADNRYEAELSLSTSFDGGNLLLMARDGLGDAAGNGLDGNFDGAPGGNYLLPFSPAPAVPRGGEFHVNTVTASNGRDSTVAMDADGDFVVVWATYHGTANAQLYAQRYNASGAPQGSEFQVNTYTPSRHRIQEIAMDRAGNFVVAWSSFGQDGDGEGVYARRYSAAGVPLGGEFRVSASTVGHQFASAVAVDDDGDFVITWVAYDGASDREVYARRYDSSGAPQGPELHVNTNTPNWQTSPSVAMDADGDFVVTWHSYVPAGTSTDSYGQRFNAAGVRQGGEFPINTYTPNSQYLARVAMDALGNFVVVWISLEQDGSGAGIFAQRYDSGGVPQGDEFQVNTFTTGSQGGPNVAMDDDGYFTVVWASEAQDGGGFNPFGIYAQRYSPTGEPLGSEFLVNTYTTSTQNSSDIAMDADGDFVVTWGSRDQVPSTYGVYAQRYSRDRTPTVGALNASPDPVTWDNPLTLTASSVADDGAVTSVSFYRETNGLAGLQVGDFGDLLVGTDADGSDGWSFDAPTTALGNGTWTFWAQATDDAGLIGKPASTTATVTDAPPPDVTSSQFLFDTPPQRLTFAFNQDISATLALEDLLIEDLTHSTTVTPDGLSWDFVSNTATVTFAGILPDADYRATVLAAGVTSPGGTAMAADHVLNFFFLNGDANHDGRVNLNDYNILAANFGQEPRTFSQGDFNYDGRVNLADYNILAGRFGLILGPEGFGREPIRGSGNGLRELLDELR